jgi:hypothetical protein
MSISQFAPARQQWADAIGDRAPIEFQKLSRVRKISAA